MYISRGVFASINRMNFDSTDIISSNAWSGICCSNCISHDCWVLMCRVEKRSECHDLSAYEEALKTQKQGDVSQLPSDTHDLHGVSRLALKNHLRGAGACSIFHSLCTFVLGMTGGASCHATRLTYGNGLTPQVLQSCVWQRPGKWSVIRLTLLLSAVPAMSCNLIAPEPSFV